MTAKVACSGPRVIPTACTAASTTHNTHVPQAHKAATWKQLLGDASSAPKHLEGQKSPDEMPAPGLSIKLLVAFLPPGPYLPVRQMLPRFLLQGRRFHCALNLSFRFRCPPPVTCNPLTGVRLCTGCHPSGSPTWACRRGPTAECSGSTAIHSACLGPNLMTL